MNHLLSIEQLSREDAEFLLAEAVRLKKELREQPARQRETLAGKNLAMVFEKPSLRTRVSFDIGMAQLGGHALYLSPTEIGIGTRETAADVARVLGRMADGIMARVFHHDTVVELAKWSGVPVINGLCDVEHPCQALADLLTLQEHKGLKDRKVTYVGDGNNVCHSLMLLCAKLGVSFAAGCPEGYWPEQRYIELAKQEAAQTGAEVTVTVDAMAAVRNADAVYGDVWTSMGQERESVKRLKIFPPYQINACLMAEAKPDAIVLHCLPAHRGEEISAEIMEAQSQSIFDQAENRLHAQKAVLVWLMGPTAEPRAEPGKVWADP